MSGTAKESDPDLATTTPRHRSGLAILFALFSVTLFLTLLGWAWRGPRADVAQGVQLLLSTTELQANTTFELRFDEAVAASEELDHPGVRVPLEVAPPLRGEWVWLSRSSGVFT
ncbi:MAG: hypothetical protein EXS25_06620, partial [Pedosphaera sp.]|nr:hypothetical protein [Pedosphaera sp.]